MELASCNHTISSRYARDSWSRVQVFLMALKCAVFVSRSTIPKLCCSSSYLVVNLSQNLWTLSPISTQGHPVVAEALPVAGVQSSTFDRLGTSPHRPLLLALYCSARMSISDLCTIYFPLGAQSVKCCDPHPESSS